MDRLSGAVERLDGPLDDPVALEANLRDLRWINRWLGGVALSSWALGCLVDDRRGLALLDVGAGAADIPIALIRAAARRGQPIRVTAVDRSERVRAAALAIDPGLAHEPALRYEVHDGLSLPFEDDAVDIAHASMTLHHLDGDAAVAFLRELGRVARRGVIVNDLDRTALAYAGARLLTATLTRAAYTRHDGPLSVRRAYRPAEVFELATAAGLRPIGSRMDVLRHRYAVVAVRAT